MESSAMIFAMIRGILDDANEARKTMEYINKDNWLTQVKYATGKIGEVIGACEVILTVEPKEDKKLIR